MSTLADELQRRGHEIIFFQFADFAEAIQRRGFRFEAIAERDFPAGSFAERYEKMSKLDGLAATGASLDIMTSQAEALFRTARPVIERAGLDLWIVDNMDYAASTLAACMGARFVTVIFGLMWQCEPGVPGWSGEPYTNDPAALDRNRRFDEAALAASKPFRDYVGSHRMRAGLGPFSFDTLWSGWAQITQEPAEFEFPRKMLPTCFHFTGPFVRPSCRSAVPFKWDRIDGKPLIYASFGTTQNRHPHLYETIVKASLELDAQVVLSLGGAGELDLPAWRPANLTIVPFAPQLEILEKAALMINHAGMNSTLECLAAGVPIVGVPIAHDQNGIAARIEWTGTGVRIPVAELEPARLVRAVRTVIGDPSFCESARRFRQIIRETDGLNRAADIIEQVLATGSPVFPRDPQVGEPHEEPSAQRGHHRRTT
jgi:MGT family glycosyltransferase